MREGIKKAGFVDDARKFFDDSVAIELFGIGDADEGEMGTAEEFFHIFRILSRGAIFGIIVVNFDGANWTQGAFVAKNEISGLVFDETVGFAAALAADFVVEEGTESNIGDDIKTFAEDVVEDLEAVLLGASHQLFFGTIVETLKSITAVAL